MPRTADRRAIRTRSRAEDDPRLADIGALIPNRKKPKSSAKSKSGRRPKNAFQRPSYTTYMASSAWQTKRRSALKHFGGRCAICSSDSRLHVHHLNYDRFGRERMSDLQVLCHDCHAIQHEPSGRMVDSLSAEFRQILG